MLILSLTALSKDGVFTLGRDASKVSGPYFCSFCHEEMILKKGMVKVHHFAHYPSSSCEYSTGETEDHLRAKLGIYDALREKGINVEVEKILSEKIRADVFITYPSGRKVAVEIQRTPMTLQRCYERTQNYLEINIPVLWVLVRDRQELLSGEMRINQQERFFHGLYFGMVSYYVSDSIVDFYHFNHVQRYIEPYYNDYDGFYVDGYWHTLKTYRNPVLLAIKDLANPSDFYVARRRAWKNVPDAMILMPRGVRINVE